MTLSREATAARYTWERTARWVLISVFAAHNIEEITTSGEQGPISPEIAARVGLDPDLYRTDRFAVATALLTGAVAVAVAPAPRHRTSARRARVVVATATALGLNGVVHLGRALVTGTSNAGVFSSPALITAATGAIIGVCGASGLRRDSAVLAGAVGAACSVPAIALTLGAARVILPGETPLLSSRPNKKEES